MWSARSCWFPGFLMVSSAFQWFTTVWCHGTETRYPTAVKRWRTQPGQSGLSFDEWVSLRSLPTLSVLIRSLPDTVARRLACRRPGHRDD